MAHLIKFEDDIPEDFIKTDTCNPPGNINIKQEDTTDLGNCDQENEVLGNNDQLILVNDIKHITEEAPISGEPASIGDLDNHDDTSNSHEDKGGNGGQGNNLDDKHKENTGVTNEEGKTGQDELGKTDQSPVGNGLKGNKGKKRPSELELLGVDEMVNVEDSGSSYDVFSDDSKIYRKYKLRKTEKKVSYKEPTDNFSRLSGKRSPSTDKPASLQCHICHVMFDTTRALHLHVRFHNTVTEYKCSQCSEKFTKNSDLIAHKSTHTSQSFLCQQCKLAFSEHCDYLMHSLIHTSRTQIKCPECDVTYKKSTYKMHILTHFDRKVSCPICSFTANGQFNLQRHINQHKIKRICVECGKQWSSKKDYECHMSIHTGVKKHQCLYCGKCFSTATQRFVHTRIHTGERPYSCDICGYTAKQLTDINRHKVTHETEKKFTCEHCHKKFFHKLSYVSHLRNHVKGSLYKCSECKKVFANAAGLKTHMMFKHLTERPVECKLCDARFINQNQYQKHAKSKGHCRKVFGQLNGNDKMD